MVVQILHMMSRLPVKRGPALLQLDEQQQQTINKRRLISNFNNSKTQSSSLRQPLISAAIQLRGYVSTDLSVFCLFLHSVVTEERGKITGGSIFKKS